MTVSADVGVPAATLWPSVDEISPEEEGGPIARIGFSYQDEVAVGFLIDMLCTPSILKVHCESHDDILLVRYVDGISFAEFVQVKGGEPDQLWSVANLCYRKAGAAGTSVFEISLARDKYRELSRFRLVTHRPVVTALKVLTFPPGAPGREPDGQQVTGLLAGIDQYCSGVSSSKGNNAQYWIDNCLWDVRHDQSSIEKTNLLKLLELSAREGRCLLPEQAQVLLEELREWAKSAGEARWIPDRDRKIISRETLCTWWEKRTTEIHEGAAAPGGGKLAAKLNEIGAGEEIIALAVEIRRDYAAAMRTPRYMAEDETASLQQRVKSEMMSLRVRYAAGHLDIDGAAFLAMCLDRLNAMNGDRPAGEEDRAAFLQGCMYDITDRCLHRFARPLR